MANTKKFIVKNGVQTPNISFKDSNTGATITATMNDSTDTLSFEGDAGQLFSITDGFDGTIFSVNDISGIPSIEVDDEGIIKLAEYNGKVLINTTDSGSTDSDVLVVGGNITLADKDALLYFDSSDNTSRLKLSQVIQQGSGSLNIQNDNGTVYIGAENATYAHIRTDRSLFYIADTVEFGTNEIRSYNGDFQIKRDDNDTNKIVISDSDVQFHNGVLRIDQDTAPSITANKLYNVGGTLFWNGTDVTSGGGGGGGTDSAAVSAIIVADVDKTFVDALNVSAGTLDGINSTSFLRSDNADAFSATLTGTAAIELNGGVTYDPSSSGAGSDTNNDVAISLGSGARITGHTDGYIRTLLEWNTTGALEIGQNNTSFINHTKIYGGTNGGVELYEGTTKRLETTTTGVTVTGTMTATTFSGSGASLTNLPSGQLTGALPAIDGSALTGISASGGTFNNYTSTDTLVAFETALADTSGGAFTLNLPASPSTNDEIIILDAGGSFSSNNLTVGRNSESIQGDASNLICDIDNVAIRLHYNGSEWRVYAITGTTDGNAVTLTGTQTLTNKTLTNPSINNYTEGTVAIGTVGASHTFSLTSGTFQTATLTASTATTFTMPSAATGKSFVLVLSQPAVTGNGTATFTGVYFAGGTAPTITAAAGSIDILSFVSDGTNWYGSAVQDMS